MQRAGPCLLDHYNRHQLRTRGSVGHNLEWERNVPLQRPSTDRWDQVGVPNDFSFVQNIDFHGLISKFASVAYPPNFRRSFQRHVEPYLKMEMLRANFTGHDRAIRHPRLGHFPSSRRPTGPGRPKKTFGSNRKVMTSTTRGSAECLRYSSFHPDRRTLIKPERASLLCRSQPQGGCPRRLSRSSTIRCNPGLPRLQRPRRLPWPHA